jgi:hypothetical protein
MNTSMTARSNRLPGSASRPRTALVVALGLTLVVSAVASIQGDYRTAATRSGSVTVVASDAEERARVGDAVVRPEPTGPSEAVTQAMARVALADEELSYADETDVSNRAERLVAAKDHLDRLSASERGRVTP